MRITRPTSLVNKTLIDAVRKVTSGASSGDIESFDAISGHYSSAHRRIYGNGEDGIVTDTAAGSHTREYAFASWTLTSAAAVDVRANPTFVRDLWDLSTAPAGAFTSPAQPANDASVATAGAIVTTNGRNGMPGGGNNAGTGAAGAGGATTTGTSIAAAINGAAFVGGTPGTAGTAGTGAAGANAAGVSNALSLIGSQGGPLHAELLSYNGGLQSVAGSSGGGDGTSSASGAGASGANPGYYAPVFARQVLTSSSNANAGVIQCKGGKGGNGGTPAAGNRGGGCPSAGSGGGCFRGECEEKLGTTHANCIEVTGGNGGNAGTGTGTGTSGTGAGPGFAGQSIIYRGGVTPTTTQTDKRAISGSAPSGTTGGVATAAYCDF